MDVEKLFQALNALHPISEEFKMTLRRELTQLSLPKNHFLLEAPRISEYAYFINDGFAVSYSYLYGKLQVERLFGPGQIVLSPKSLFEQLPSREFIQLIIPSDVLHLSYTSLLPIFDTHPEAHILYRIVMNQYYESSRERWHDLLHLTAEARYLKLLKSYPRIEQLLSQEYVASYLGLAAPSLSRLKKRIKSS